MYIKFRHIGRIRDMYIRLFGFFHIEVGFYWGMVSDGIEISAFSYGLRSFTLFMISIFGVSISAWLGEGR